MSGIMIDPEKLIEFFDRQQEESCEYRYDISTTDELRQFLYDFCHNEVDFGFGFVCKKKIESEKEQPTKSKACPKFNSITYFTREQAQKHLEVLRDAVAAMGKVSIRDYYRFAEFLQILPKWTAMYFNEDYGWKDLSTARINTVHSRGVDLWTLEMPEPKKLD